MESRRPYAMMIMLSRKERAELKDKPLRLITRPVNHGFSCYPDIHFLEGNGNRKNMLSGLLAEVKGRLKVDV